jgi:hypothetical protein
MGGKESNAWQKDIGESGTTDHKFRTEGDALKDRQQQQYAEQKAEEREAGEGLIPKRGENPVLAEVRARNAQSAADREAEQGKGEDEVDELSEQSFPASDPPPHP